MGDENEGTYFDETLDATEMIAQQDEVVEADDAGKAEAAKADDKKKDKPHKRTTSTGGSGSSKKDKGKDKEKGESKVAGESDVGKQIDKIGECMVWSDTTNRDGEIEKMVAKEVNQSLKSKHDHKKIGNKLYKLLRNHSKHHWQVVVAPCPEVGLAFTEKQNTRIHMKTANGFDIYIWKSTKKEKKR